MTTNGWKTIRNQIAIGAMCSGDYCKSTQKHCLMRANSFRMLEIKKMRRSNPMVTNNAIHRMVLQSIGNPSPWSLALDCCDSFFAWSDCCCHVFWKYLRIFAHWDKFWKGYKNIIEIPVKQNICELFRHVQESCYSPACDLGFVKEPSFFWIQDVQVHSFLTKAWNCT